MDVSSLQDLPNLLFFNPVFLKLKVKSPSDFAKTNKAYSWHLRSELLNTGNRLCDINVSLECETFAPTAADRVCEEYSV